MHDRVATPFMITVQAPHWPSPQPNRGPCRPRSLRRIYKRGVDGSISNVCTPPLTFNVTLLMVLLYTATILARCSASLQACTSASGPTSPAGVSKDAGVDAVVLAWRPALHRYC